jgi:hypothetical protein
MHKNAQCTKGTGALEWSWNTHINEKYYSILIIEQVRLQGNKRYFILVTVVQTLVCAND